ncbi:MAG TPA: MBL fold metallo-hydrolase [Verrucomicrobiae bacterium]|nr:MBL fold metallo-hydrolase [Verrucomicrobiae bacterium]
MNTTVVRARTSGTFTLDGDVIAVENNVWVIGDAHSVLVIDTPHRIEPILEAVGGRRVVAIVCTHGHNDHVNAARLLSHRVGAPVALHPADRMLWDEVHPDAPPDRWLADGDALEVGGTRLTVLHTPGHTPGSVCLHWPQGAVVFSGDTLFQGGPGATGRSHSDFPTIIHSITTRLLTLPPVTSVRTGHGDDTTIGAEAPHLDEWLRRGA